MSELLSDITALARHGARQGGITRLAWSRELFSAYEWLIDRFDELDIEAGLDPAGNLIAKWSAGDQPALLVGSHIDTVPDGGRLDGALGVLSALDAVRRLRADGYVPRRPIWIAAFMDEEGARFETPMLGSRAFVGYVERSIGDRRDSEGVRLDEAMASAGFAIDGLAGASMIGAVSAYLELHIEQGPVLEAAGADIGLVQSIFGSRALRVRFQGHAAHAGTTPMDMRRDALVAAARSVTAIHDLACERPKLRATVGQVQASPGASNVVPGSAEISVDLRAATTRDLDEGEEAINEILRASAARQQAELSIEVLHRLEPVQLDRRLRSVLADAAAAEQATAIELPSGAGHDAMIIGPRIPAAMLFVPSRDGISHHPAEHTSDAQCIVGARVLQRAIVTLTS